MPPQVDPEHLARLVDGCRRGDGEAFNRIFAEFRGPIYSYLARSTRDPHLAEDMLQDVFLRMIENLGRYEESGRFEAWLFRIAANLVRDWARRRSTSERVGGVPDSEDPDGVSPVDRAVERPPEVRLVTAEDVARLEAALNGLQSDERQVLLLRHYGDLSFRQIADIMDCPIGTVLARSHRALLKLRKRMDRLPDERP